MNKLTHILSGALGILFFSLGFASLITNPENQYASLGTILVGCIFISIFLYTENNGN